MIFTSREFLVFFVLVAGLYYALPHRLRWAQLLIVSYIFYMASEPAYGLLLLFSTTVAWASALAIERSTDERRRRFVLYFALTVMFGLLFTYKYLDFFLRSVMAGASVIAIPLEVPQAELLLPLGISFFTFQGASYVVDVYRRIYPAEHNFGVFALFKAFFPQLIAGPIERAGHLLPQFRIVATFDLDRIADGAKLMLWGAFKKLVIADNLATYVDAVYGNPEAYTGVPLILATVFFAFQIYCDFSGYVDIARGAARVLGIQLSQNFDRPYGATSVAEFWHRWHITLSTWFRDYVYIPLGGNRRGPGRHSANIFLVFLISGLWHGANWTFVIWGGLHGMYLLIGMWTARFRGRAVERLGFNQVPELVFAARIAVTFTLVCFAWIFFRAASVEDAFYIVAHLGTDVARQLADGSGIAEFAVAGGNQPHHLPLMLIAICALFLSHAVRDWNPRPDLAMSPVWLRWSAYYGMVFGVLFWGAMDTNAFIYFRF